MTTQPIQQFITHKNEIVTGARLENALVAVAKFWEENALAIRKEDAYASHVTEERKEQNLQNQLDQAKRIRQGTEPMGFWLWQRINTHLTGECVAFLPGGK